MVPAAVATKPLLKENSLIALAVDVTGFTFVGPGILLRIWAAAHIDGRNRQELIRTGPWV